MVISLDSRGDFTLANYAAVSRGGASLTISAGACARMTERRAVFMRYIDAPPMPWVYGVTGSIVAGRAVMLTPAQRRDQVRRPIGAGAVALGESLPGRIARGAVFCRLANFIEGHAAVRAEVASAVAAMLDAELPPVPVNGHGAAGEMLLLSHLFGGLVEHSDLREKEASALVNGAPFAAALTADALLCAGPLLREVIDAVARAIDVYRAPIDAYDAVFGQLWGSPHAERALALLARAMRPRDGAPRLPQAPVSFRAAPRLLARALGTYASLGFAARRAIGAVTDNPLMAGQDASARVLFNGGFFDADAPPLFDEWAGVCADLIRLLERLGTRLAETADFQVLQRPAQARLRGLVAALSGYAEDAAARASRTPLPGADGGGAPQNDLISPAAQAWVKQAATADLLSKAVATLRGVAVCVDGGPPLDVQELDQALNRRMVSQTHLDDTLE